MSELEKQLKQLEEALGNRRTQAESTIATAETEIDNIDEALAELAEYREKFAALFS